MIDNIDLIKPLLTFEKEGDFYMLYVFKRKKDQEAGQKDNNQSVRTIKTYCIDSLDYLDKRYEEVKGLCELFQARAYIHVQRQNHRDVGLDMMIELASRLKDGASRQHNLFDSVVGQLKVLEKRWVVDIDFFNKGYDQTIRTLINKCDPVDETNKIIAEIPTKNGYHLITSPFNLRKFQGDHPKEYPFPDIQKKNPTVLYYPDSLK